MPSPASLIRRLPTLVFAGVLFAFTCLLLIWWARQDLNLGPMDYESTALTAELRALNRDGAERLDLIVLKIPQLLVPATGAHPGGEIFWSP